MAAERFTSWGSRPEMIIRTSEKITNIALTNTLIKSIYGKCALNTLVYGAVKSHIHYRLF